MKFEEFEFGFADATKEFTRLPDIFEKAFCDPRRIVNKLMDSYQFLLIGRKGVGKSAFSSKIQSMASKSKNLVAVPMNLNDFEFTTFSKTNIDSDVTGTQKYKTSWDFLLLLSIYKILFNELQITEVDEINEVLFLLDKMGFSLDSGFKADVTKLSKLKIGNKIVSFDIEFEKAFNMQPQNYLERISLMSEKMLNVVCDAELNGRQISLVIDGFDDILRYKKNKMEIIASLIRSADYLNDKLAQANKKIKILLLIREDLITMVTDPDLNKIIHDGAITINWSNRLDDLKHLVELRFALSGLTEEEAKKCWGNMFPKKIKEKDSWDYALDHTLYKPRDILQFLKYCQKEYPDKERLTLSETQKVLKVYSNQYFIEEMKNELSGFVDDEIIIAIPSIFRRLGGRAFGIATINKLSNEQCPGNNISIEDTKVLLMYLFEAGYIGQLVSTMGRDKKRSVVFKYRNPTARIDYYQQFITHQGLHKGLGVRV
ncbi:MAG: hypothetical protein PHX08_14780 [Lachnospiraceae bacterium]|nr:hypothetical protein [Lachnospiraceae bacterium]